MPTHALATAVVCRRAKRGPGTATFKCSRWPLAGLASARCHRLRVSFRSAKTGPSWRHHHGGHGRKEIGGTWDHAADAGDPGRQLRPFRTHREGFGGVRPALLRRGRQARAKGRLGAEVSIEDGQKAAQACAINLLAQVKAGLGDLDKITRVVRLGGFINSAPGFPDGPKVMNGASDLMVSALGDKGRHARSTVGVAALPMDAAVEVEGEFEVA